MIIGLAINVFNREVEWAEGFHPIPHWYQIFNDMSKNIIDWTAKKLNQE
jgi:hypothetical protein